MREIQTKVNEIAIVSDQNPSPNYEELKV